MQLQPSLIPIPCSREKQKFSQELGMGTRIIRTLGVGSACKPLCIVRYSIFPIQPLQLEAYFIYNITSPSEYKPSPIFRANFLQCHLAVNTCPPPPRLLDKLVYTPWVPALMFTLAYSLVYKSLLFLFKWYICFVQSVDLRIL